jgi:hypothetical protein
MSRFSTKAVDLVGVFDASFRQMFPGARPLKASVKDDATFFKHPLEDGEHRTDHIIFNPVEVTFSMLLSGANYKNVYQQIKQAYKNQVELIVQTKVDTYPEMYLQGIPHEESPETFDSIIMNLKVKETMLSNTTKAYSPALAKNANTVDRGQTETVALNTTQQAQGSVLGRWLA